MPGGVLSLADVLNIMSVPGSRKFAPIASNVLLFVDYFGYGVHLLSGSDVICRLAYQARRTAIRELPADIPRLTWVWF